MVGVFHRGIARGYPAFAALTVFYPVRAILLFVLPGHAAPDVSEGWSDVLSVVEILLEAWLVVELTLRLMRARGGWNPRRYWGTVAVFLVALAGAVATAAAAPNRVPVDRTQVFFWWAMLALGAATVFWLGSPSRSENLVSANLVRVCGGFATFSLCQLVALAGRAHAFAERSRHAYVGWSYLPAVAYILVVMYWLVLLGDEGARERKPSGAAA